jgi:hypothetical protein
VGRDGCGYKVICVFGKSEYFFERGWTAKSLICPSGYRLPLLDRALSAALKDQAGNFSRNRPARSFARAAAVV